MGKWYHKILHYNSEKGIYVKLSVVGAQANDSKKSSCIMFSSAATKPALLLHHCWNREQSRPLWGLLASLESFLMLTHSMKISTFILITITTVCASSYVLLSLPLPETSTRIHNRFRVLVTQIKRLRQFHMHLQAQRSSFNWPKFILTLNCCILQSAPAPLGLSVMPATTPLFGYPDHFIDNLFF